MKETKEGLKVEINESQLWSIYDAMPEDGVMVEWGAGGSTVWFADNIDKLKMLVSLDRSRSVCDRVNMELKARGLGDKASVIFCQDDFEYSIGSIAPVGTADIIVAEEMHPAIWSMVNAKRGCHLFLLNTRGQQDQWVIELLERDTSWARLNEYRPVPEDEFVWMEMIEWLRL